MVFKDVCKRDMIDAGIDNAHWEQVAAERVAWKADVRNRIKTKETIIKHKSHTERLRGKMVQDGAK